MMNIKDKIQQITLKKVRENDYYGLCRLSPRSGKTKIGIDIINELKPMKVLWVTYSSDLVTKSLPEEFAKWDMSIDNVVFTTYASLHKYKGKYDFIILDEYHHLTDLNAKNLLDSSLCSNAIVGLSGTHPKSEDKLKILSQLKLKIIADLSIKEASERGVISDYEIIPLKVKKLTKKDDYEIIPLKVKKLTKKDYAILKRVEGAYSANPSKKNAIIRNAAFSKLESKVEFVKNLRKGLLEQGNKVITVCSLIKHADEFGNAYHSKVKKKDRDKIIEKYNNDEINYISIVNAGGTGVTYLGTTDIIIYKFNNNQNGNLTQKLCRPLINDGIKPIIWCVYYDHPLEVKWLENTIRDLKK